ncbi:MAG: hypothetical protein HYY52_02020 [Candidatus Melainabacteria bacterium]|nr:hypothetical protein [Candidatus Melainabacteria bacterium]
MSIVVSSTTSFKQKAIEPAGLISRGIAGASEIVEKATFLRAKGNVELARTILKRAAAEYIKHGPDFAASASCASALYRTHNNDLEKATAARDILSSVGPTFNYRGEIVNTEVLIGIAGSRKDHPDKIYMQTILEPIRLARPKEEGLRNKIREKARSRSMSL